MTDKDPLFGISTKPDTGWDRKERDDEAKERAESERLREIHKGDPAYDSLHSPAAIRRKEQQDREEDRTMGTG